MVGRKCSFLVALGAIALCLLAPGRSSAQAGPFGPVDLRINDAAGLNAEQIALEGIAPYGFDPASFTVSIQQEGIGQFGLVDLHGEWFDATPLAPGQIVGVNFNLIEPPGDPLAGTISDTLSLSFSGHSPNGRLNNMSVDAHFRSDTLDEIGPPALVGPPAPFNLTELNGWMDLTPFVRSSTGLSSFSLSVQSAVPEPGSMAMLGGIAVGGGLMVWRRRRR